MIPAGGIKDQELTIIALMMLISALLRWSRAAFFKHPLLWAIVPRVAIELADAARPPRCPDGHESEAKFRF
jgi:hypothetical protein